MPKIIAVANRKGGVGKTTTVICLGHFLGRHDRNVLLIDLDPQNALSAALLPPGRKVTAGAIDVLGGMPAARLKKIVAPTRLPNVDLVPYGRPEALSHEREALFAQDQKRSAFTRSLSDLSGKYDYILIDSPPGSSAIVEFSLLHAHSVIIPLQCQPLALRIMPRILSDIKELIQTANPSLAVEGVLLTMYDFWDPISQNIASQAWSYFPKGSTFRAVVRRSPVFERIFDRDDNPLLRDDLPEELLDYDVIALLILAKEKSPSSTPTDSSRQK